MKAAEIELLGGIVGIDGADRRGVTLAEVVVVVLAEVRGGEVVGVARVVVGVVRVVVGVVRAGGAVAVVTVVTVRIGVIGSEFVGSLTDLRPGVGNGRGTVGGRHVIGV